MTLEVDGNLQRQRVTIVAEIFIKIASFRVMTQLLLDKNNNIANYIDRVMSHISCLCTNINKMLLKGGKYEPVGNMNQY